MDGSIHILIVNDQTVERKGLSFLLNTQPQFAVVGEAASGKEAVVMARNSRPEIAIVDHGIFNKEGPGPIWRLCRENAGLIVVVLCVTCETAPWMADFEPDELVYVRKDAPPEELAGAIRAIVETKDGRQPDRYVN